MISEAREHLAEYIKWILGRRAEAPGVATELAAIEAGWNEVLAALTPPPVAAPRDYFLGLGFDPGWAKTGIGAVAQHRDGSFVSAGVDLVLTSPDHTKKFQRQSVDDNRRLEVYFAQRARRSRKFGLMSSASSSTRFSSRTSTKSSERQPRRSLRSSA